MARMVDEVDRKISEWEKLRASIGDNPPRDVEIYIQSEIDRLRHDRRVLDRPCAGGRRDYDPKPGH